MIEVVWEFIVKEEARGRFELTYGPGGAWSTLFGECPGYRGTTLLRDTKDPCRYVTVDFWDSEAQREQMLRKRRTEYSNLDAAFREWTESETELGAFRVLAEATVRPSRRARHGRPGEARRGSRGPAR